MKLIRPISLVLLCIAFVPSLALGQTPEIDALREKAEKGDADAQIKIGFRYFTGVGVAKDDAKALNWFRKAAESGNAGAQFDLGVFYEAGRGVPKDDKEAVKWYRKAAEQGY